MSGGLGVVLERIQVHEFLDQRRDHQDTHANQDREPTDLRVNLEHNLLSGNGRLCGQSGSRFSRTGFCDSTGGRFRCFAKLFQFFQLFLGSRCRSDHAGGKVADGGCEEPSTHDQSWRGV